MQTRPRWSAVWAFAFATTACGGAATSSIAPMGSTSSTGVETVSSVSAAPPTLPAPAGPPPTAKVVKVTPSKESPAYAHVEVGFDNKADRPCKIQGYVLSWPGGKKDISLDDFSVPAHDGKTRSVKVHPDDGDLASLTPEKASVALRTDCDH